MNCLIRVHPICNNIGSIGVHFGIELAFYIIRYLACLNVLVKCYQTPAQRMRALTNSVIDTVMHYHIYHYNRPSAIGHQPSAIGNHRWYLAKKAVPIYIYIYIYICCVKWSMWIIISGSKRGVGIVGADGWRPVGTRASAKLRIARWSAIEGWAARKRRLQIFQTEFHWKKIIVD